MLAREECIWHMYYLIFSKNLNLIINTDNQALVHIINNQTVKKNKYCLKLLRIFVLKCMKHSIMIRACHIPGVLNRWSDMLSRQQVSSFLSEAVHADREPTVIPQNHRLRALLGIWRRYWETQYLNPQN